MKSERLSSSRFCGRTRLLYRSPRQAGFLSLVFVERKTRLFSLAAIWRLIVCGRPSRTPLSRAAASPALIRSTITVRSNSAAAARICICNRRQDCFRCYRSPVKSRPAPCCAFQIPRSIEPAAANYARAIKLIHANHIDAAFATLAISSSKPVLLKTRGAQNLHSAHCPTPVDLDSFYNRPAVIKI